MATIVDGKMRSGELKDNDQVVVDVEAAGEGIFAKKSEVDADIQRIDTALAGKQDTLTFDNTPIEGSSNPVTSDGIKQAIDAATPEDYNEVKSQVQQNTQDIAGIEAKIPAQASAQNQLADKAFVNSSIQTNTATFRGTYNLVTDLGLTVSATEEQTATAIATHLASLVPPVVPENNDYVFVQVPRETSDPTVVVRYDRYKCSVTEAGGVVTRTWGYEYSLNNSSFTADQWAAINSGITSGDVTKIQLIDTLVGRGYIGFQSGGNKVLAISGEQLTAYKTVSRRTTSPATTYPNKIGFKFNLKEFVAYCLGAINDPIGKSTIDQVQLNGSAKLDLYFPTTTTADFVRIGVYTSPTATTPVSVSETQLIGSLDTITEYTFEFSSQQYLTADATYYFRIEDDSGTAIPCYIYASNKFTGFSWAFINSDGTAGSDISSTMPDLQLGCNIKTYYTIELEAKDLVALENFSQQKTYAQGERVVYNNDLYEVKAGGHAAGAWNSTHFRRLLSLNNDNVLMQDGSVVKRSTYVLEADPSDNVVIGTNGAKASGFRNIVLGYGATAERASDLGLTSTDTNIDNVAIGSGATIRNVSPKTNGVGHAVAIGSATVREAGGIAIGQNALASHINAVSIGTGATSHGDNTTNFKTTELSNVYLGENTITDLINQAVADQLIKAAVSAEVTQTRSTPTATRKLLALNPVDPTGEKTEVTAQDIGAATPQDVYAAVQQIAPNFTVKEYALNDLCSYNGVVYRCKSAYTATASSAKPSSDTTHWEAKKVSELFLPLAGGTVGDITVHTPGDYYGSIVLYTDGVDGPYIAFQDYADQYILFLFSDRIITHQKAINFPIAPGTFALLEDIAPAFSTSATYDENNLCVYNNKLYRCTTAITTAEEWTAAHWTEATVEDVLELIAYQISLKASTTIVREGLALKAPLASPAFTGTPTAPTPTAGDNSTKVATTAFVKTAVDSATPNLDYVMQVNPETGEIYYTTPDTPSNN